MNEILTTLFLSNPYLPGQVCDFCNQLPEFRKAEQDYNEIGRASCRERVFITV